LPGRGPGEDPAGRWRSSSGCSRCLPVPCVWRLASGGRIVTDRRAPTARHVARSVLPDPGRGLRRLV